MTRADGHPEPGLLQVDVDTVCSFVANVYADAAQLCGEPPTHRLVSTDGLSYFACFKHTAWTVEHQPTYTSFWYRMPT